MLRFVNKETGLGLIPLRNVTHPQLRRFLDYHKYSETQSAICSDTGRRIRWVCQKSHTGTHYRISFPSNGCSHIRRSVLLFQNINYLSFFELFRCDWKNFGDLRWTMCYTSLSTYYSKDQEKCYEFLRARIWTIFIAPQLKLVCERFCIGLLPFFIRVCSWTKWALENSSNANETIQFMFNLTPNVKSTNRNAFLRYIVGILAHKHAILQFLP